MTTIEFQLHPRLVYQLVRVTSNENGHLVESVAEFNKLEDANDAGRAIAADLRRHPPSQDVAVKSFTDYRQS